MKKTVLILAVLVLAVSACIRDKIPEGAELGPGDRLPEFSVILDDGSVVSTGDLSGKVSVIVFFHTGCPDCQAELPVIQRIHDEFSPEAAVLCISREEDAADIAEYWAENGLTLPYSAQKDRTVPVATYEDLAADILDSGFVSAGQYQ